MVEGEGEVAVEGEGEVAVEGEGEARSRLRRVGPLLHPTASNIILKGEEWHGGYPPPGPGFFLFYSYLLVGGLPTRTNIFFMSFRYNRR